MSGEGDIKSAGDIEWIPMRFGDLQDNDLFWVERSRSLQNSPFRKINDATALHLREQIVQEFVTRAQVYLKEH
jgi:hypothetical protein